MKQFELNNVIRNKFFLLIPLYHLFRGAIFKDAISGFLKEVPFVILTEALKFLETALMRGSGWSKSRGGDSFVRSLQIVFQ